MVVGDHVAETVPHESRAGAHWHLHRAHREAALLLDRLNVGDAWAHPLERIDPSPLTIGQAQRRAIAVAARGVLPIRRLEPLDEVALLEAVSNVYAALGEESLQLGDRQHGEP